MNNGLLLANWKEFQKMGYERATPAHTPFFGVAFVNTMGSVHCTRL